MPKQQSEYNKFVKHHYSKVKGSAPQDKMRAVAILWKKKK